ncbi:MAG TPA: hypothetical protein VI636_07350 [Candidatus Angelobacter sp.]
MKKSFAILALLALIATPALAEKLTGYVSDAQCATSSAKAAKATDWINPKAFESCAQKCVKNGSPMVFVTEDNKILKLDADSTQKATAHLGHRVSVEGKIENGTLKIDKIATIKMATQAKPDNHQEENMH